MYNPDRKDQFISDIGMTGEKHAWIEIIFNSTEPVERELGKDIAEMTAEETGIAVSAGVMSHMTITNRIPVLIRYKNWCRSKGFKTVMVRSDDIKPDISSAVRSMMVYSPSQLAKLLKKALPDIVPNSPRSVYRAYLWFCFAGLRPHEAVDVDISGVDLRKRLISYNNRWYRIYEEGYKDIKTACSQTVFSKPSPGEPLITRPRDTTNKVLRGWKHRVSPTPEQYVRNTLRSVVQAAFSDIGRPGMSALKLRESGLYYELLGREIKGLDISVAFYTLACDEYEYNGLGESVSTPKTRKISRYKLMYQRGYKSWKEAYKQELMREFGVNQLPGV